MIISGVREITVCH